MYICLHKGKEPEGKEGNVASEYQTMSKSTIQWTNTAKTQLDISKKKKLKEK